MIRARWKVRWMVVMWTMVAASPVIAQENDMQRGWGEIQGIESEVRLLQSRWIDIAAHLTGAGGTVWRTDVVVLNTSSSEASVELVLHIHGRTPRFHAVVPAYSQMAFEDVVGLLGHEGKGPLEIRSDQPLTVHGRTYSNSGGGTVGQFVDGYRGEDGLDAGESGWLAGLRQLDGQYRSNVCITNTGEEAALVRLQLHTAGGFWLMTFPVLIEPGEAHHEIQPFWYRRGRNDIACGCVRIDVLAGSGILASASVVDQRTNDAITVPMKR